MSPQYTLALTQRTHDELQQHLFPGDGKEAAAVLVCSRTPGRRRRLLVRQVVYVPYADCSRRSAVSLTWPSTAIERGLELAEAEQLALILIHSHPGGTPHFSSVDDRSDLEIIPCLFAAHGDLHGTAVMLPNGFIFGRIYDADLQVRPIDLVNVVGSDLKYYWADDRLRSAKRPMAFTSAMTDELGRLTACVIGVSGTGSIVAEQVCRLGFGRVILIDYDKVERKNLNRILNTNERDAIEQRPKVLAFAGRVNQYRQTPYVVPVDANLLSREAILEAADADVLFSCVDKLQPRSVADCLTQAFLLPLLDIGVAISTRSANGASAVDEVAGRIDYVTPDGSSLLDRGVYSPAALAAEALLEADPKAHTEQVRRGYITDVPDEAPAVICLNMRAASACVMEFIGRAYPFRHEPNSKFSRTRFMLAEAIEEFCAEDKFASHESPLRASGSKDPLLGMPILAPRLTDR